MKTVHFINDNGDLDQTSLVIKDQILGTAKYHEQLNIYEFKNGSEVIYIGASEEKVAKFIFSMMQRIGQY